MAVRTAGCCRLSTSLFGELVFRYLSLCPLYEDLATYIYIYTSAALSLSVVSANSGCGCVLF